MRCFCILVSFLCLQSILAQTQFINYEAWRLPDDDNKEILKNKVQLLIEKKTEYTQNRKDSFLFDPKGNLLELISINNQEQIFKLRNHFTVNNLLEKSIAIFEDGSSIGDTLLEQNNTKATYGIIQNGNLHKEVKKILQFNEGGYLIEEKILTEVGFLSGKIISYNQDKTIKQIHYNEESNSVLVKENYFYSQKRVDSFIIKEKNSLTRKYIYRYDMMGNIVEHYSFTYDSSGKTTNQSHFIFKHQLDKNGNWIYREQFENGKLIATRKRTIIYYP